MLPAGHKRLRTGGAGFTLLEVMVAIAILAIALTTLLLNQNQSLFVASVADFSLRGTQLADQQLVRQLTGSDPLSAQSGTFAERAPGYSWSLEEIPVDFGDYQPLATGGSLLKRVALRVERNDGAESVTLHRFILVGVEQ